MLGAVLRNPIRQLFAEHITAVGITTKNANSDSGISPEFLPKIGTAKRTSKCIRILTNINSRKGFFYFSHQNVPDIRPNVSSPVAHVPVWPGAVGPGGRHVISSSVSATAEASEHLPQESGEMSKLRVKFSTLYSL